LPGDRHEPRFRRVLELSMRTTLTDHGPPFVLAHLDHFANFTIERAASAFYQRSCPTFWRSTLRGRGWTLEFVLNDEFVRRNGALERRANTRWSIDDGVTASSGT